MNEVYKMKETSTGAVKVIPKDDTFDPPQNKEGSYMRLSRQIESLYDGALILGTKTLLYKSLYFCFKTLFLLEPTT